MRSQLSRQVAKSGNRAGGGSGGNGLVPPSSVIPDKLYFRIGEVARICGIQTYVLRFWESEFPQLRPGKSGTGQRLYRKRDVEMALKIRKLLYEEGYTIPGARQAFQQENRSHGSELQAQLELKGVSAAPSTLKITRLKAELREILGMLSEPPMRPHLVERGQDFQRPTPISTPELFHD